jgi:hypothetical protein
MIATTYRQDTRRHRWWTRGSARPTPVGVGATPFRYDRPADVLAVLEHARAIVEAGWVQNRWTVTRPVLDAEGAAGSAAGRGTDDAAVSACVVAAVAVAVRARDPRADLAVATGPAVAAVWDAVQGGAAHGGFRGRPAAGRAAPHAVRVARMRDLVRWNDRPGRTRDDVVAALDRAAALVVAAAVEPVRG